MFEVLCASRTEAFSTKSQLDFKVNVQFKLFAILPKCCLNGLRKQFACKLKYTQMKVPPPFPKGCISRPAGDILAFLRLTEAIPGSSRDLQKCCTDAHRCIFGYPREQKYRVQLEAYRGSNRNLFFALVRKKRCRIEAHRGSSRLNQGSF